MNNVQNSLFSVAEYTVWTVAVVGSRSLTDCPALVARLEELRATRQLGMVVSGGAAGVDALAAAWCRAKGVALVELRPDYRAHGAGATHVRNAEVVRRAGLVLVCWDGVSRGTLSAARSAARLGRCCEWLTAPPPRGG